MRPITPQTMKISAMARAGPVPNHGPIASASAPSVIDGITQNWAIGPIRKAVIGEAAVSSVCAKPNTRPCSVNGTTFWMTVCSDASANGISSM